VVVVVDVLAGAAVEDRNYFLDIRDVKPKAKKNPQLATRQIISSALSPVSKTRNVNKTRIVIMVRTKKNHFLEQVLGKSLIISKYPILT